VLDNDTKEIQTDLGYPNSELVFALVYPVGTDYSSVRLTLENYIKRFRYEPNVIQLSKSITEIANKVGLEKIEETDEALRIHSLMTAGNKLCELAQDAAFIVKGAVGEISSKRTPAGLSMPQEPLPRVAHILLSLKRPDEVDLLRAIYGPGFYLIGVFASEHDRLQYLTKDKNISRAEASRLMHRDEDEDDPFGQRSRDTFQLSDVFIQLGPEQFKPHLERFLDLIFGNPFLTPEPDEHAMFLAYSASLRSGQLARQVGAAIRSSRGDIIAVGCNDVPAAGGGLYWPGDKDNRDHIRGRDSNDMEQLSIVKDVLKKLDLNSENKSALQRLKNSRLMDITEYGRAVHAEMDALLACMRVGVSPVGGSLFTTTFPCHNCTRHIIAGGIKRVVYIEPYPKSLAAKLHDDSIELPGTRRFGKRDDRLRVPFQSFVGIGPRRFFDLFSMKLSQGSVLKRKREDGRLWNWKRDASNPRIQMSPTSYIQREKLSAFQFKSKLDRLTEEKNGVQRFQFGENSGLLDLP
jgi:deoxycytidylate deaminase